MKRVLRLLESGREVSVIEIASAGGLQYAARIYELRRAGFNIVCRVRVCSGKKLGYYTLLPAEPEQANLFPEPEPASAVASDSITGHDRAIMRGRGQCRRFWRRWKG